MPNAPAIALAAPQPESDAMTDSAVDDARKRKAANRFAVLNAFIDFSMRHLAHSEVTVWMILYRDTKPDGLARTSQADLARRAGTTPRTVRRAVVNLKRRGLLKVVHRGGLRSGVSRYRVLPQP